MATNHISMNFPYPPPNTTTPHPPPTFEGGISRAEDIPLLRVISISTLVCPLSKKIFSDPVRLPCGHVFDRSAMTEWYRNNAVKICPMILCQKPYDSLKNQEEEDPLRKELAQSFNRELHRPNEGLRNKIYELYNMFADSQEKQEIKAAIDFFVSGELSQGIDRMTGIMMRFANGQLYLPILNLMKMQMQTVSNQINHLVQQAGIPPVGHFQIQPFSSPMAAAGVGMPQSLSTPFWNGTGGGWPGNFYVTHNQIQQIHSPEAENSQIQGFSASVPVIRTGMPQSQSLLVSSRSHGMGLQQPIAFNSPLSLGEIRAGLGEKTLTFYNQRFIDAIKKGTNRALEECLRPTDVDVVMDANGNTPLLWIIRNHPHPTRVVETLLQWGANPNAQNNDGQTALHLALQSGTVIRKESMQGIIEKLLEWGARADSRDKLGRTPFESATTQAGISVLNLCLAKATSNQSQSLKRPLENSFDPSKAKRSRSEPSMREGGVTGEVVPISEQRFISAIKAHRPSHEIFSSMRDIKNVDIVMDEERNTPLLWVVANYKNPKKVVETLLERGANPNVQNHQGQTALHLAIERGAVATAGAVARYILSIIEELVKRGAWVDSRNQRGQTALHLAAERGKINIVNLLLEKGASVNIKDNNDQLPVDVATGQAKSVLQDIKEKKETEGTPTSHTDLPPTFENREDDDSEVREEEKENESVKEERLPVKNDENSQKEDFEDFDKLFASTRTEEEELFPTGIDQEQELFPTGIDQEEGFFTDL